MHLRDYFLLGLLFTGVLAVYEDAGEHCETENKNGTCVVINECSYAKKLLQVSKRPQHCGFQGHIPIVCCPLVSNKPENPVGSKSIKKCEKYHHIFGERDWYLGEQSLVKEFPHMALLGYGEENNTQWLCGGSLISEYFILTAAHCLYSGNLGNVTVRLGELDTNTTTEDAKPEDYGISETFPHPEYKPPSHYNDIALLKLDRKANINSYVTPACLHTDYVLPTFRFVGTGWGKTDYLGETSSHLLKARVHQINHTICAKTFSDVSTRKLKNGIIDEIQLCAGSPDGADACEGDSGGPLQYKVHATITPGQWTKAHYAIVGIISFGKACGLEYSVGVYTRIAPYTEWIENIVWP